MTGRHLTVLDSYIAYCCPRFEPSTCLIVNLARSKPVTIRSCLQLKSESRHIPPYPFKSCWNWGTYIHAHQSRKLRPRRLRSSDSFRRGRLDLEEDTAPAAFAEVVSDHIHAEVIRPQGCLRISLQLDVFLGRVDEEVSVALADGAVAADSRVRL